MYKYILIIYDEKCVPKDVYYSFDSISAMLEQFGCDNLLQLKNKYKCVICECISLF